MAYEFDKIGGHFEKKGTQTNYFVDSIDTQTRFMVASNYCKDRSGKGIKAVIQKAKDKTGNQIIEKFGCRQTQNFWANDIEN